MLFNRCNICLCRVTSRVLSDQMFPEMQGMMQRRTSILDVDPEGTAMLRILDRGPVSEGLRENPTAASPEEKEFNPAALDY